MDPCINPPSKITRKSAKSDHKFAFDFFLPLISIFSYTQFSLFSLQNGALAVILNAQEADGSLHYILEQVLEVKKDSFLLFFDKIATQFQKFTLGSEDTVDQPRPQGFRNSSQVKSAGKTHEHHWTKSISKNIRR